MHARECKHSTYQYIIIKHVNTWETSIFCTTIRKNACKDSTNIRCKYGAGPQIVGCPPGYIRPPPPGGPTTRGQSQSTAQATALLPRHSSLWILPYVGFFEAFRKLTLMNRHLRCVLAGFVAACYPCRSCCCCCRWLRVVLCWILLISFRFCCWLLPLRSLLCLGGLDCRKEKKTTHALQTLSVISGIHF